MQRFLLWSVIFLSVTTSCYAGDESNYEEKSLISKFGVKLGYTYKTSYWFTSDSNTGASDDGTALKFKPESIPSNVLQGEILFEGDQVNTGGLLSKKLNKIFRISYESPVSYSDNPRQNKAISYEDKNPAIVTLKTMLDLRVLELLPSDSLLHKLNNLRFDYKYHDFYGKASVMDDADYIANDLSITHLHKGDTIRFSSVFSEISASYRVNDFAWLGIYKSTAEKLHQIATANNQVVDSTINGYGLKIIGEGESHSVDVNIGVVKFELAGGYTCSNGADVLIGYNYHPKFYLIGSPDQVSKQSLVFMPALGGQLSFQMGGQIKGQSADDSSELNSDVILDVGASLVYKF